MAGENIGRVEFLVGLDGSRLPTEARTLGNEIGAEGGKAGDKWGEEFQRAAGPRLSQFSKDVGQKLSEQGKLGGRKLADDFADTALKRVRQKRFDVVDALFDQHGFDDFVKRFGNIDDAVDHLKTTLSALNQESVFKKDGSWAGLVVTRKEMEKLSATTDEFADNLRGRLTPALKEGEQAGNKFTQWLSAANKEAKSGSGGWKSLSANTRQWTAIIAAVIASFSELAVLGSAAGSGLFVVGAALSSLGLVGGLAVTMFTRLLVSTKKLDPALVAARKEFDAFHKSVSSALDAMTNEAFKNAAPAFKSLTGTVKALTPALVSVGHVFGQIITQFADGLKPGTENVKNLSYWIEQSGSISQRVVTIVGTLGTALLAAFANPNLQRAIDQFLGWLGQLIDGFSAFLRGPGFDEWLRHGESVFGAFGQLLATTGQLLNDMVTDETVRQLVLFIDHIDGFLKGGGRDIIDVAQKLDIFGLLAQLLDDFGQAIGPLSGPLQDMAKALNAILSSGISTLAGILGDVAKALAPFVQQLADFMALHPQEIADGLIAIGAAFLLFKVPVIGQLAASLLLFSDGVGKTGEAVKKLDVGKIALFAAALGGLALSAGSIVDATKSQGKSLGDYLRDSLLATLGGAITGATVGVKVGGPLGALIGGLVGALFGSIGSAIAAYSTNFGGIIAQNVTFWGQILGVPEATRKQLADKIQKDLPKSIFDFSAWIPIAQAALGTVWAAISQSTIDFFTGLGTSIANAAGSVAAAIGAFFGGIGQFFVDGFNNLMGMWAAFWQTLGDPGFWNFIADSIGGFLAGLINGLATFIDNFRTGWNNFWAALPGVLTTIWTGMIGSLLGWFAQIASAIATWAAGVFANWNAFWSSLPGILGGIFSSIVGAVLGWLASIANGIAQWALGLAGAWSRFWSALTADPVGTLNSVWSSVVNWGVSTMASFAKFFSDLARNWNNFWGGLPKAVGDAVSGILGWIDRLMGPVRDALSNLAKVLAGGKSATSGGGGSGLLARPNAAGSILTGPTYMLGGEAGPEAVVPLRRPLSMVNPDVRWLSAIAQRKPMPGVAGGPVNGGRTINVAEGAIQIFGAADPRRDANEVLVRLAEQAAG